MKPEAESAFAASRYVSVQFGEAHGASAIRSKPDWGKSVRRETFWGTGNFDDELRHRSSKSIEGTYKKPFADSSPSSPLASNRANPSKESP